MRSALTLVALLLSSSSCSQQGSVGASNRDASIEDAHIDVQRLDFSLDANPTDAPALDTSVAVDAHVADPDPPPACRIAAPTALTQSDFSAAFGLSWNGTEYTAFYYGPHAASAGLQFQRWTPNALAMAPSLLITESEHRPDAVVWNATGYAVSYYDSAHARREIAIFDTNGASVGEPQYFAGSSAHPAMAWNGEEYGVVYRESGLKFARVSASGATIGSIVELGTTNSDDPASIVWTGGEYGIAWAAPSDGNIFFHRIRTDGVMAMEPVVVVTTALDAASKPALAWTGSDYVVAWHDEQDSALGPQSVVRARRISATGALVAEPITVASATRDEDYQADIAIAANGSTIAIAWLSNEASDFSLSYDLYVARYINTLDRIAPNIRVTSYDPPRAHALGIDIPLKPRLLWNGEEYVASYFDSVGGNINAFLQSVCY